MKTQMNQTHTPGPWKLNGSQVTANGDWKAPVCVVVSKEDQRPTADAAAQTREQAMANARLIAAAPELLECLRSLVYAGECDLKHRDRFGAMFAKAQATIALATA